MNVKRLLATALIVFIAANAGNAAEKEKTRAEYIRANYAKYEYRILMRDGATLFTAVYVPNDRSKTYPILLLRTPYTVGPYGSDKYKTSLGPSEDFEKEGYIFAFQDVRGRFMSEDDFVNVRPFNPAKKGAKDIDENTDTYDTIEWLVNNIDNNNGKVGQWGISYPGFYTSMGMIDTHPALKAVSPQAPIGDWFWDDVHQHGAFRISMIFGFFARVGVSHDSTTTEWPEDFKYHTSDAYQFFLDMGPVKNADKNFFKKDIAFWTEITEHPNYDAFWQARNILPHLRNITCSVMTVGGWYDAEDLYGTFKTYRAVEKQNPGIRNTLVIGPWSHGGWQREDSTELGDAFFGYNTSEYYAKSVILPYFNHFLKDDSEEELTLPEALIFETGANRWRSFDVWPPNDVIPMNLYFHDKCGLSFNPQKESGDISDSYISDPMKPVPYSNDPAAFWPRNYMTEDQRYASRRPDVLVYKSDVLEEDITIAGPLTAKLFVATTGTDTDFVVKLIDVQPGEVLKGQVSDAVPVKTGAELLIRSEVLRGRFRESYSTPKPFKPGEPTPINLELLDVLHTFKRGHRIMIHIQSSWFPLVDRNPQTFVPSIFNADEKDFVTVTNSVYRSKQYPSHIEATLLKGK